MRNNIKKILLLSLLFSNNSFSIDNTTFINHQNFCNNNDCSTYPSRRPPKTVIFIHGMDSTLNATDNNGDHNGNFIRIAYFLEELGKDDPNYNVYGIDYGASELDLNAHQVKLVKLNHNSRTCNSENNWENCWNILETSQNFHTPLNLTIRKISSDIREILQKAAEDSYIEKNEPVTIIAHSMGGLIIRDMLYNGDSLDHEKSGYEILKDHGVWINEYVSLAAPHNHGFFAIDDTKLNNMADFFTCKAITDVIDAFNLKNVLLYQYCMLENWEGELNKHSVKWHDGKKVSISKLDFPQIRWVFAAATGERLLTDNSIGDGLVEYRSALYHKVGDKKDFSRADKELIINEYADHDNFDPINDLNMDLKNIPGHKGYSIDKTYSGFPAYSNSTHSNINNVGFYFGNQLNQCSYKQISDYDYSGIAGCVGYFQYIIPSTTLCLLPGFSDKSEYYRRNPQFGPNASEVYLKCHF